MIINITNTNDHQQDVFSFNFLPSVIDGLNVLRLNNIKILEMQIVGETYLYVHCDPETNWNDLTHVIKDLKNNGWWLDYFRLNRSRLTPYVWQCQIR